MHLDATLTHCVCVCVRVCVCVCVCESSASKSVLDEILRDMRKKNGMLERLDGCNDCDFIDVTIRRGELFADLRREFNEG